MPSYNNNFVLNCIGKWRTKSSGFDPVRQQKETTALIHQGWWFLLGLHHRWESENSDVQARGRVKRFTFNRKVHIAKVGMLPSVNNLGNRWLWNSEFRALFKKYHRLSLLLPRFYQRMQLFSLLVHMARDSSQLLWNTKAEMGLKMLWAGFPWSPVEIWVDLLLSSYL